MASFDELENAVSSGTKLARAAWNGEKWAVAPLDRSTLAAFGANVLQRPGGLSEPWPDVYFDTAEADWEVLP